MSIYN
jgi:hypothetical protein